MRPIENLAFKLTLSESHAFRKLDHLSTIERQAIDAANRRAADPLMYAARMFKSSSDWQIERRLLAGIPERHSCLSMLAEQKEAEIMRRERAIMGILSETERRAFTMPQPRAMLTLNQPIRQVHDTSRQQLQRAQAKVIAQARELSEDLKEGERVVVYFKSGDDRVQVNKIEMDDPYLKLKGKDVNGNDTAILITPNDLHYFAFKVETLPPDKSFGF